MANTISYPKATAKSDDLILGTSMPLPNSNDDPRTVNFSVVPNASNCAVVIKIVFVAMSGEFANPFI